MGHGYENKLSLTFTEMACCSGAVSAERGSRFGSGNGSLLLRDAACTGKEISIDHCSVDGLASYNCESDKAAGVVCQGWSNLNFEQLTSKIDIRVPHEFSSNHAEVCCLCSVADLAASASLPHRPRGRHFVLLCDRILS